MLNLETLGEIGEMKRFERIFACDMRECMKYELNATLQSKIGSQPSGQHPKRSKKVPH